ncbi:MAG: SufD family Fe-S cluster assembly protein [Proteiniphilum sp.]
MMKKSDASHMDRLPVDFSKYKVLNKTDNLPDLFSTLSQDDYDSLKQVGLDMKRPPDMGRFLLFDHNPFVTISQTEGVEILPLPDAMNRYPWMMEKYYFKAIDRNMDEFTRQVAEGENQGYFIRVKKNVRLNHPIHAGFLIHTPQGLQNVHNIVVLEEGAHLHLITGCVSGKHNQEGLHIAVSENYVASNAKFINTMIHNWGPDFVVRPRAATIVAENATFVSNYYSVSPPKNIESIPYTHLEGNHSSAKYMTVLASMPNSYCDIGGTVLMGGENTSAELVARAVNYGGTVLQTGLLIGAAKGARGHVDCSGLMLSDGGVIEAVPGLRATHPDARMSHEAAIGKIDMGEVNYLQSKGLSEMQAIALIIRGFLNIGIEVEGLDVELEQMIQQISELSGHGE